MIPNVIAVGIMAGLLTRRTRRGWMAAITVAGSAILWAVVVLPLAPEGGVSAFLLAAGLLAGLNALAGVVVGWGAAWLYGAVTYRSASAPPTTGPPTNHPA